MSGDSHDFAQRFADVDDVEGHGRVSCADVVQFKDYNTRRI